MLNETRETHYNLLMRTILISLSSEIYFVWWMGQGVEAGAFAVESDSFNPDIKSFTNRKR